MPIYEFYCAHCHAVFNFLARTMHTTKRPACPRCARPDLERWVSRVAISKGLKEGPKDDEGPPPDFDEAKMEQVMAELEREGGDLDEENPRQMAHVMRKLYEASGMPLTGSVQEAIRRMEAGESPEKIEEEMGDVFGDEDSPAEEEDGGGRLRGLVRKFRPPEVDETLYDL